MGKSKTKAAKVTSHTINHDNKSINLIFIFAIISFMLIVPFYRGLFFRENYIPSIIVVGFIFVPYALYKLVIKSPITLNTYMDIVFACIPTIYLISFFSSVNAKDAFDQFLIYSAYFMIYKMSSSIVQQNNKYKSYFINGIILSTFILSLTSILDIMGIIDLQVAFVGKRFFGLYQYPNTTASVLGVGIILAINTIINEKNIRLVPIYQIALTSIIVSFIFTLSRGAYLIVSGVMLFNFFAIDVRKKLKFILSIFISFLSSSYLIYKFYTLVETDLSQVGKLYIYSIILSGIIAFLIYSYKRVIKINFSNRVINIALILLAVILAGTAAALFSIKEPIEYRAEHTAAEEKSWKYKSISLYDLEPNTDYILNYDVSSSKENKNNYRIVIRSYNKAGEYVKLVDNSELVGTDFSHKSLEFKTLEDTKRMLFLLYNYEADSYTIYKNVKISDSNGTYSKSMEKFKYIPGAIARRLEDINLETNSSAMRITFAKDGLEIIKDYPLLGAGGGAWKNLYRKYQSIPYNTTETHNYYVQYGTEVGIIGLIILAALLLLFIYNMYKAIKNKSKFLSVYIAALQLLLHSSIDFNLSLVAVGYLLWLLMGVLNGEEKINKIEVKNTKKIAYPVLIFSLTISLLVSFMYYGVRTGGHAAKLASEKKDIQKAIELYEKAMKFDRFNAVYRFDMAQIMNNELRKTKEEKYYTSFMDQIDKIRKYEPYNHRYTPTICSMYLAIGKFVEASILVSEQLIDMPMVKSSYNMKIDVNYQIANFHLKDELLKEAMPYLIEVLEVRDEIYEINKNLEKPIKLDEDYQNKINGAEHVMEMIKEELNI